MGLMQMVTQAGINGIGRKAENPNSGGKNLKDHLPD